MTSIAIPLSSADRQSWSAVLAMSLAAFALVALEFMPVSLLTPLASEFRISEGQAGLAISVSGAFALITSLFIAPVVGRLDRKLVLLALTLLMVISGTIAAFAPNYASFMVARAFIGVAIGGFWSMSAATTMRLVPADQVPKALAIVNGGNALASVLAAPLGSYIGALIGWRGAFFFLVPVTAIAFVWKMVSLPPMKAKPAPKNTFRVLKKPSITLGMLAVSLFFMGQFTLFTYLRPYLETVTRVGPSAISLMLLLIGLAGLLGTIGIGRLLRSGLHVTLITIPAMMAFVALALIAFGASVPATAVLLALWGLLGTSAPVAWWTWLAGALPQDAEAGGGLMVAIVQLAIAFGATGGGYVFDHFGYQATFVLSSGLLILASALAYVVARLALAPLPLNSGALELQT